MTDDLTPPHWGTSEFVEPEPGEVFDLDRALSLAVTGYRVRATNMQPGAYVDYQFNGWRINFPGGSSSGWTPRDIDREAEWVEVPIEAPKPAPAVKGGWDDVFSDLRKTEHGSYVADAPKSAWANVPKKPAAPPIVKDVIELPGVVSREQAEQRARADMPVWAPKKALDPNKGGW